MLPRTREAPMLLYALGCTDYEGGCAWLIGSEGLHGGGDLDYNDVVLRVQRKLRQEE